MGQDLNNIWRVYDKAVVDWIESYNFHEIVFGLATNQLIEVRFAALNKQFSKGEANQSSKQFKVNLPDIAVTRISEDPDLTRNVRGAIREWYPEDVSEGGPPDIRYKKLKAPKPYKLSYQIDFRSDKMWHLNQMTTEFQFDLMPEYVLDVPLPEPYRTKYASVLLRGITNQDMPFEQAENESTVINKIFDITVDAWLFADKFPDLVKRVEKFYLDFKDMDTDTTLDIVEVPKS